jgi:hypothetical protein
MSPGLALVPFSIKEDVAVRLNQFLDLENMKAMFEFKFNFNTFSLMLTICASKCF